MEATRRKYGEAIQKGRQGQKPRRPLQTCTGQSTAGSAGRRAATGNQTLALGALARQLAGATNGLGLFTRTLFRRLLVKVAHLHFTEDAFTLHLLLESAESLIDIVIANEYLHECSVSLFVERRGPHANAETLAEENPFRRIWHQISERHRLVEMGGAALFGRAGPRDSRKVAHDVVGRKPCGPAESLVIVAPERQLARQRNLSAADIDHVDPA